MRRLKLANFRNFESLELEIPPGFTILAGQNAQGKTSILEALYWLSTTRMLRGVRDAEAIRQGAAGCMAETELETGTTVSATLEAGARKKFFLNGASLPRAADVIGRLPSVVISIFDLEIVRGDPSDRRLFIDIELSSLSPAYLRHLTVYKRALEQRNALLKMAQERSVDAFSFDTWEEPLAKEGAELRRLRNEYIAGLAPRVASLHSQLSSRPEQLGLRYVQKDEAIDAESLLRGYQQGRGADIHRGATQTGPHRDDVEILVDGQEARLYGSQGQQRTAVIALKLGTLESAKDVLGEAPLLLLDDMLSDLDAERRARLCHVVATEAGQAILTCTEARAAGDEILDRSRVYSVQQGTVSQA
ncbi:MAG: DNA replication/repair protein RecF [Armatimonadetes bacterium]|nr:DNA replication/repair protein RecF [Armatimonadota bacterium]